MAQPPPREQRTQLSCPESPVESRHCMSLSIYSKNKIVLRMCCSVFRPPYSNTQAADSPLDTSLLHASMWESVSPAWHSPASSAPWHVACCPLKSSCIVHTAVSQITVLALTPMLIYHTHQNRGARGRPSFQPARNSA